LTKEPRDATLVSRNTIVASDLSIIAASGKALVQQVSFSVSRGQRLAIVGPEGSGKSTLVEYLAGHEREGFTYSGRVSSPGLSGYLPQELAPAWGPMTVMEFLFQQEATDEFDLASWNSLGDAQRCLHAVGLSEALLERRLTTMSGGQAVRIQLAKLLLRKPTHLILDEPTNNLDLETINWLEQFIISSSVPVVFVSHDETLIRRAATSILYVTQRSYDNRAFAYFSSEGYDAFTAKLKQAADDAEDQRDSLKRELRKLTIKQAEFNNRLAGAATFQRGAGAAEKGAMRRGASKSSNRSGSMGQKIEDLSDQITNMELPHYERDSRIDFPTACSIPNGKQVLVLENIPITIEGRVLVRSVSLSVIGPERVGIVGVNGIGKSTLLRMIRTTEPFEGVRMGYMPQDFLEILPRPDLSALDFLKAEGEPDTAARTCLSRMGFSRTEVQAKVGSLSGGQRGKLILLHMAMNRANFLVLDEPTRNLSPLTAPVLREELLAFPGAVLVVSHDRTFLSGVCTRVLELTSDGLRTVDHELLS
jgi:ATPase subunit of ABC transporter with duplicated ATPase domains